MEPDSCGAIRMGEEADSYAAGEERILIWWHSCGRNPRLGESFQQRISQKGEGAWSRHAEAGAV